MKIGQKYYVISHAYFHYVGVAVEVGPRSVVMENIAQVHGCGRDWTSFFAEGFKNDTRYDIIPDGAEFSVIDAIPWKHDIPKTKAKK